MIHPGLQRCAVDNAVVFEHAVQRECEAITLRESAARNLENMAFHLERAARAGKEDVLRQSAP